MPREILPEARVHPAIRDRIAGHHADIVAEVERAVAAHDVVVVGMRQNPFPRRARKARSAAGVPHRPRALCSADRARTRPVATHRVAGHGRDAVFTRCAG